MVGTHRWCAYGPNHHEWCACGPKHHEWCAYGPKHHEHGFWFVGDCTLSFWSEKEQSGCSWLLCSMHHIPVTEVKRHLRMFECLNPAFVNLQDHPSDSDAGWEVDLPATELTAFSGYFRLCPGMCNPVVTPQTFLLHVAFPLTQAQEDRDLEGCLLVFKPQKKHRSGTWHLVEENASARFFQILRHDCPQWEH